MTAAQTGIPAGHVIISASHTHQGGPTISTFLAEADPDYAIQVAAAIAKAVGEAWQQRREASNVAADFGRVAGIHFNRRFLMRDGREVTHPGKMNPQIVRSAGPVDDKVGVLAFRDGAANPLGLVVNFGCHCTVTEDGEQYSADYVHYLREHLRRMLPGNPPIVFLLGACGDVTQIDNRNPKSEKGHPHADFMGVTLASEISRVVDRLIWQPPSASGFANQMTSIPIREHDLCDPPRIGLGSGDFWEPIFAREAQHVAQMRAATPRIDCHITALRIGDLAIVANGAELFAQPALDIQAASPIAKTWVVTLANEYIGYVPTAAAHFAGGYEVRTARSSFLAPDAAQKIVQASLLALNALL